jgi:branched-chain amino acid transport system permease protein
MFGPLVGTTLFIVIREIVSSHWEHHSLIVGLLAILAVIFAPKGIVGLWNGWMTRLGERDAAAPAKPRLTLQAEP